MKIYIVSCDKGRQERLLKACEPLHLNIEIVESLRADDPIVQRRAKGFFDRGDGYPTGVAATLGHMIAMERFLKTNDEFCMIGEDDIRFDKKFNEKLDATLNFIEDADIVSLGFCSDTDVSVGDILDMNFEGMKIIRKVNLANPWGAQLYIISRKYAQYFLNRFSVDDLSTVYDYKFVTDCVIFDHRHCKRYTLMFPIAIEDPNEQSISGNDNKMPINIMGVEQKDFYF